MSLITVEVAIEHGKLTAKEPHLLPETGVGLLTILHSGEPVNRHAARVTLPLIHCVPGSVVNPRPEDLDDSLWD